MHLTVIWHNASLSLSVTHTHTFHPPPLQTHTFIHILDSLTRPRNKTSFSINPLSSYATYIHTSQLAYNFLHLTCLLDCSPHFSQLDNARSVRGLLQWSLVKKVRVVDAHSHTSTDPLPIGSIRRLVRNDRKKFNEMRWLLCLTQSVSLWFFFTNTFLRY